MTLTEFLAWEERQQFRYESDDLRPIAMAGGTAAHAAIQRTCCFASSKSDLPSFIPTLHSAAARSRI